MTDKLAPSPAEEIDPRLLCQHCGSAIDQHHRVDTPEGPEFHCDDHDLAWSPRAANGHDQEPPPHIVIPEGADADRKQVAEASAPPPEPEPLETVTPASWRGTEPLEDLWLAYNRIPGNDLTMFTGNGGAGKTETAVHLCINVAAGLGDWLGSVIESGPALFFSGEEQEQKLRKRVNRICKHRGINPDDITDLHLYFPDLEDTTLVTADRNGRLHRTPLLDRLEKTIAKLGTRVVVIDSVAAVFDADVISRRQVRTFCAIMRKIANKYDTAIVLLDHPSVRGMNDGSGTSNSVDWRNGPRAMLYLSDPAKDDPDGERIMEVKKNNDGPIGEQVKLRWNGLTLTTSATAGPSPHKANTNRQIDETFLRCLDIKIGQRVDISAKPSRSGAAQVFAQMAEASGVKAKAFAEAQERLLSANKIKVEPYGAPSDDKHRIVRGQLQFQMTNPREEK
jgi:RecA-family ATPase